MKLGRLIDRYIIVPITKLTVLIKDSVLKDSKKFEKIISKRSSLLIEH
jgi:hypothetical protein